MPSYQQSAYLEEAVRSVLEQQVDGLELLVMDPGSTDGSRQLLLALQEEYGERLVLYFEADQGQSDAVNRGMARARGRILGWLNSDDRLRPGALARVSRLAGLAQPRWVYGRAGMIDKLGRAAREISSSPTRTGAAEEFSRLKLLTENFIPQMAVFWNRAMWERAGGLDNDRHLDMDYDLWLRFARVADAAGPARGTGRLPGSCAGQGEPPSRSSARCRPGHGPQTQRRPRLAGEGGPGGASPARLADAVPLPVAEAEVRLAGCRC